MAHGYDGLRRYNGVAIAFHWTIAAAIIVNLVIGIFHDGMPRGWGVMPVHKAIGVTVLLLSLARLAWRLTHRPPPFAPSLTPVEKAAAHGVHLLLYALMILVPLTGWMMSSVGNPPRPLNWFGLFPIPYLPVSPAVGGISHDAHQWLGYLMAALVVGHVGAALRHHWLLRDDTLTRMLPGINARAI